ncbi:NAD-dependent epimerase/dehydratase family protein [Sphingobacterium pedocola]|uniref:Epimerase n=1 Tax=Sphingobacterium pedocola TaxID=2082722 RepID=A0ABR9T1S8_9SPHI|nr:NAD-dependent epimerase/dehydratase family protein [Sphingobacterium pedocola]MBE8719291.1 epimerase [Sphingobacterium pedocola]
MDYTLQELEQRFTAPSADLIEDIKKIDGDILLLGIGGKMGPSMGKLAVRAAQAAGVNKRIIGVSRFSEVRIKIELEEAGIETISCDLLDDKALQRLPDASHVIYLAGNKFGTAGNESFTWAMNAYLPGRVAERFKDANIVALSSGNVLPFVNPLWGGATEDTAPEPIGEYAQSCLGRERILSYFSKKNATKMLIYRLNYAVDFRYGVVMEIAKSVLRGRPIDLHMAVVNVIWQGDANEIALRALLHTDNPARILNVTGPETVAIAWIAKEFGNLFGIEPIFINVPVETALLNNASDCHRLFGYPKVSFREIIDITATWLRLGGEEWDKSTHFQERGGKF